MNIGVIVQATDASPRFPGQALHSLDGKLALDYLLESLQQCDALCEIVVAASRREDDDDLHHHCKQFGVDCIRGSLRNVVGRLRDVLLLRDWDAFVRVDVGSPLLDYRLVSHAVGIANRVRCDLVTNVFPNSFPHGQSVEVIFRDAFLEGYQQMHHRDDLQRVTPYFYSHVDDFKIVNFTSKVNYREIPLAIGAPEDIPRIEAILAGMNRPHWEYSLTKLVKAHRAIDAPSIERAA